MKRSFFSHPLVLLVVAFALGCAAQAATSALVVAAQTQPERNIYRECFTVLLVRGQWIAADDLNEGATPSSLARIPDGWHVAAGGGGGSPNLILCR
jgi:hypothetical protein